jgi:RHH-type proline utilization regulon transcriptional repressor/proline dehydrogenase/delta 1-pyrroline-5-carboxylate dehydrogenase
VTAAHGKAMSQDELAKEAIELAKELLADAKYWQTDEEERQARQVARMMSDPRGKALTIALCDQTFRSQRPARVADQLRYLLQGYGQPRYLSMKDRLLLGGGGMMSGVAPEWVVPAFKARLRKEMQSVVLPAEEAELKDYLDKRRQDGMRLNLNLLGEAVLGEHEARSRLDAYLRLLARDDVEYISVKLSSIFSQINLVAFEQTLEEVQERLRTLYRAAMSHSYQRPDGSSVPKFINLDMEEYHDLLLTLRAFKQVLDEPEFFDHKAGLVLQAYLPDSFPIQQELTAWARERQQRGGAPIKIRIVKGANLAMEQVDASLHDWPQAPYTSKHDVDANFKRMITYGCQPEHAAAAHLGIASHNLFDLAYGIMLRAMHQVEEYVEFEMLEGMANHQARAVQKCVGNVLLYAPVVKQEDFQNAIAYLMRRLDENTDKENFLHDVFDLAPDTEAWNHQRDRFLAALNGMEQVPSAPHRTQDRRAETVDDGRFSPDTPFRNEPDTDWSLPANRAWIHDILEHWQSAETVHIPLQVGGEFISEDFPAEGVDPSRPGATPYRYAQANHAWVSRALDTATQAQPTWSSTSAAERRSLLLRAAAELARNRGDLIGAMVLDGGKAVREADTEVSEAVDFASYYARSLDLGDEIRDCRMEPLGVVVVAPPWNFPLAIPVSGVLGALMAGNTVIFKPAPEATLVGWQMVQMLWQAGIPKDALQFLPAPDNEVGQALVTDPRTAAVILTGARSTAMKFHEWKPDMQLFAETSGKNALIITAMADREQAVKDLVRSAFGHNGQKCSAASLAICEAEVYDSPDFRRQLHDAAVSLSVGSAWEPSHLITPLAQSPATELQRAQNNLEQGEEWLLEPHPMPDNPRLWSPGIKLGVRPGSFFHQTECFGPVLGVMRAKNLEHAIELANDTVYGLTSGLHSLDHREHVYWQERIQAGNAYINRHITGSIVQRQSFGGWKGSVFGPGAKTGGPNYVLQLARWYQEGLPTLQASYIKPVATLLERYQGMLDDSQHELLRASAASYAHAWQHHFSQAHDPSGLLGESNRFRYRRCEGVLLCAGDDIALVTLCQAALAARTCNVPLTISLPLTASPEWGALADEGHIRVVFEDMYQLISRLQMQRDHERMRVSGPLPLPLRQAARYASLTIIEAPILANGRLELRHYLREQIVSHLHHRYGNIVPTPAELRAQEEQEAQEAQQQQIAE